MATCAVEGAEFIKAPVVEELVEFDLARVRGDCPRLFGDVEREKIPQCDLAQLVEAWHFKPPLLRMGDQFGDTGAGWGIGSPCSRDGWSGRAGIETEQE